MDTYSDGYDDGYAAGKAAGYDEGYDEGKSDFDGICDDKVEEALKDAKSEMEYEMDVLRSSFQTIVNELMDKVTSQQSTIYQLRKENATITRTVQKHLSVRDAKY